MDLTHTSSGPVLLVPTARYNGVCLCVCAQLSAVMHTCKADRISENTDSQLLCFVSLLHSLLSVFIYRQDKHLFQHLIQSIYPPNSQDSAHVQLCCPQDG